MEQISINNLDLQTDLGGLKAGSLLAEKQPQKKTHADLFFLLANEACKRGARASNGAPQHHYLQLYTQRAPRRPGSVLEASCESPAKQKKNQSPFAYHS